MWIDGYRGMLDRLLSLARNSGRLAEMKERVRKAAYECLLEGMFTLENVQEVLDYLDDYEEAEI